MTRVAIYTRVSSEEQVDGYSLSAQVELSKKFAEARGWTVVAVYEERGRSGKSTLRPEFQQMIQDAENKLFDIIVVHKLDRFSRSILDMLSHLKRLNEIGITLASVSEDFDFSTPMGKVMLTMIAAFAQWYLHNLSLETSKGKRERARKGDWNGCLSFGYTTVKRMRQQLLNLGEQFKAGKLAEAEYSRKAAVIEDTLEEWSERVHHTAAIPCPFTAEGVRLAFSLYSTGKYSDLDIAIRLNQEGYRSTGTYGQNPFSKDTIREVLQNPFYVGEVSYKKKKRGRGPNMMEGNHLPLISAELYKRCQEVRKLRKNAYGRGAPNRVATYPLASIAVCVDCGSRLNGWFVHNERRYRDPAKQRGVQCPTHSRSVSATVLEEQIETILFDLSLPIGWQKRVLQVLHTQTPEQQQAQLEANALQAKLERLKNLYVMGDLSEQKYEHERTVLQNRMNALTPALPAALPDLVRAGEMLQDIKSLWYRSSLEERETRCKAVFQHIYVREGVVKAIEPTKVMWALLDPLLSDTRSGDDGVRYRLCIIFISFPRSSDGGKTIASTNTTNTVIVVAEREIPARFCFRYCLRLLVLAHILCGFKELRTQSGPKHKRYFFVRSQMRDTSSVCATSYLILSDELCLEHFGDSSTRAHTKTVMV